MKAVVFFATILSAALAAAQNDLDGRLLASKELLGQGKAAAAEQTLRVVLEEAMRLPAGDIRTVLVFNNLGAACNEQGRFRDAAGFFKRAVDFCVGDCRSLLMARFTANLANAYMAGGELAALERMDLPALIEHLSATAPRDPEFARLLIVSGQLSNRRRRLAEAEQFFQRALTALENAANLEPQLFVLLLHDLALVHVQTGRMEEATSLSERAYGLAFSDFSKGAQAKPLAATGLGTMRLFTGRYAEAEQLYETALRTAQTAYGPTHPLVGHIFGMKALVLERTHRRSEAKQYRKRAANILGHCQRDGGKDVVDLRDLLREASRR